MKKLVRLFVFITAIFLLAAHAMAGEKVFFYYTDPAGTPLAMTDSSGNVVWRADYKPFGEEQSVTQNPENVMKFVGKEKDKETGLYYFGARYMKAEIGRFTSPDPVGTVEPRTSKTNYKMLTNPQRLNRYAYALNNPYKYLDPNGKEPMSLDGRMYYGKWEHYGEREWYHVFATREGLVGARTATGHVIDEKDIFVALPSRKALNKTVVLENREKSLKAGVLDVGPWNTNDPYWESGKPPQAESGKDLFGRQTNKAGIDLSNETFRKLGLKDNTWIWWSFENKSTDTK